MEKAKKKAVSFTVFVAIVATILVFALAFSDARSDGFTTDIVASDTQAGEVVTDAYTAMTPSQAMDYYNSLTGYTAIENQDQFNTYFGSGAAPEAGSKFKLKPYNGDTQMVYTASRAKVLDSVTLDGCGAKIRINSHSGLRQLGTGGADTAQADLNIDGANTMFKTNKRETGTEGGFNNDEGVYIKVSGGFADYALGATIKNVDFEYSATLTYRGKNGNSGDSFTDNGNADSASWLFGGVFGAMSVNSSDIGCTVENCRIVNNANVTLSKIVPRIGVAWEVGAYSRAYHGTVSFGTLTGYIYNGTVKNCSVEMGSSSVIGVQSYAVNYVSYNTGTPRAIAGGAIGIMQNNSTIENVFISGGGAISCDSGSDFYDKTGTARLGLGGGLVGCTVDNQNSNNVEFMVAGEGNCVIKNIVSTWNGAVWAKGYVSGGSVNYEGTYDGVLVGISGVYNSPGTTASGISGNFFLYNGTSPDYRTVMYPELTDKAFTYVSVALDSANYLADVNVSNKIKLGFSSDSAYLTLDCDVSSDSANRTIIWSFDTNTTGSDGSVTPGSIPLWDKKGVSGYSDATKQYTATISATTTAKKIEAKFVTGQAVFYKVEGDGLDNNGGWAYTDTSLGGNLARRDYSVSSDQYSATALTAPVVQFYLVSDYDGAPRAISQDAAQWGAKKNGTGDYYDVNSNDTKNVGRWYLSLRSDASVDQSYAYYATVNGKNYVAYKAENQPVSASDGTLGAYVALRNYIYEVVPKVITPSVSMESDLVYDAAAKENFVNFNDGIIAGDSVSATVRYYVVGDDGELTENDGINAGSYIARITALNNSNYELSSSILDCPFEITQRVIKADIVVSPLEYNGAVQTPVLNMSNMIEGVSASSVYGSSFTSGGVAIEGDGPVKAGTYNMEVRLTTSATLNYILEGETTADFEITPAYLKFIGASEYSFVYNSLDVDYDKFNELSENKISFASVNDAIGYSCDYQLYFREYKEGDDSESGYTMTPVSESGVYDCLVVSNNTTDFYQLKQKIKVVITPATLTFGINPSSGQTPDEQGNYTYNGKNFSFTPSYIGLGALDIAAYNFRVMIYPAVYDEGTGAWVKADGDETEGSSVVKNAGNYIAILEQTSMDYGDISENKNYDLTSNPGTRELAFAINKATLVWQFSGGEGLIYHEDSGEYRAEYNGDYYVLSLEAANLEGQLAEGDKGGKYALTGNVEYFRDTQGGIYSVGTQGVRDAGNYIVVPEVECGRNPELSVNYDIKGGVIAVTQKVVTIVIEDISVPYGTHFDEITGEGFSKMWSYAPGSNEFLPEDGNMLTFYLLDVPMDESPVRGTYAYTFRPSPVNPNVNNYQINCVYEAGDNADCTITGLELKVEVVVTDMNGEEIGVYPVDGGTTASTDAVYNGGAYTVSLRATNADPDYIAIEWVTPSFSFTNVADSNTVRFQLAGEVNKVYYIGQDLSATSNPDGVFDVTFTVNKRTVTVKPVDVEVEYGKEFQNAGVTFGGEGFVGDDTSDIVNVAYGVSLGAEVGSTSDISLSFSANTGYESKYDNYSFVSEQGTATRVARVLHVTFGNREKVYGESPLSITEDDYTLGDGESVVEGDSLGLAYVLGKDGETFSDEVRLGVGTYSINATASNANYEIVVTEGSEFNVNPKQADVTLEAVSVPYDTFEHPVTVVSIIGLVEGDEDVTATIEYIMNGGSTIQGAPVNRGTYTANVTGFSSPNYAKGVVSGTNTVEITNVKVNVTVNDAVMAYGTGNIVPADGGAFFTSDSTLFDADDLQPYYIYNNGEGDVKGLAIAEYPGTLTLGFKGAAAGNYDVTFTNAADLSVVAADLGEVASLEVDHDTYDGNGKNVVVNGVMTAQVEVVITKDGVEVDRNTGVVDAGEYVVTVTPLSANYTGTATLVYTVEKADFDGTLSSNSSVYDGNAVDLASLVSSKYGQVVFTITLDGEQVSEVKGAGVYTITATAGENSNYQGSVEGLTYTVEKKTIETPGSLDDFEIEATWNGFTVKDASGNYEVLVSLDNNDWSNASDSISGLLPETEYTVYIKFAADENHNESGVLSTTITTGKKLAAQLNPDDVTFTVYYNRIVVNVEGDEEFAYRLGSGSWQNGNTFSGLKASTEYSVSVKIKENSSHGESNVVTLKVTTGTDPAAFNDVFNSMGETVTAADVDKYEDMIEAYESLSDGDKANVDKTKLEKLQNSYKELVAQINSDVIAAQNVARKAAGKGAAAAAASVLAVVVTAIVAKKKFVF